MGGDATRHGGGGGVVGIIRYRGIQSHFTRTGCDLPSCPPVHLFMSTILYKYSSPVWADVISFWGSKLTPQCAQYVGAGVPRLVLPRRRQQPPHHVRGRQSQRKENYLVGIYCRVECVPSVRPTYTARFLSLNGRSRLNLCSCAAACHGACAG